MTTTNKVGRPRLPKGEGKSHKLQVRLTEEENGAVMKAADRAGKNKSDWARDVIIKEARPSKK